EHLLHLARTCPGREARLMDLEWLRDDPTDPHAWIEAGERVLEDDLQVTAQMLELRCRQIREGPPQPGHAARARADELQCRPREGRLPRARLSDHTQRLSRMQLEADIVQCREHATARAPRAGPRILHRERGDGECGITGSRRRAPARAPCTSIGV